MGVSLTVLDCPTPAWRQMPLEPGRVALWWLGQAGFAVRFGGRAFWIDPYLSDSLAVKYRHAEFQHVRLMPPPIDPETVGELDWIFCTHRHGDHMDGPTLGALARGTACRFHVPASAVEHATAALHLPAERVVALRAGRAVALDRDVRLTPIPSAHEALDVNERGEHLYLGLIFRLGGLTIYHAGDCCPYDALADALRPHRVDIALLPVNGRDAFRAERGVPGNFHFEEALALCETLEIPRLIPHHVGMFAFNTVDPADLRARIDRSAGRVAVHVPELGRALVLEGT